MQNIIDYLDWRGDVPFSAAPFNPVDNLILSQFSYISLDGIAPGTMREVVSELIKLGRVHDNNLKLSKRLAESRRFGSARVSHSMELFDPKLEMQFGALVVDTDDGATCVAFRGTDATLVGWKEDLNMSFSEEVPSQGAAVQFLNDGLRENTRPLRVMGHSKGGNLAVYASAMCRRDVQDRIVAIYNNDGPGLCDSVMSSEGYARIESRVSTFVPQSSVVGMLMNHTENYQVIHAYGAEGIEQHDPYVWDTRRDNFVCEGGLRRGSLYTDRAIKEWLKDISNEKRKEFIDAIYSVLQATHAHTVSDLTSSWARSSVAVISAMGKLEPETRKHIHAVIGALISSYAKTIFSFPQAQAETADVPAQEPEAPTAADSTAPACEAPKA